MDVRIITLVIYMNSTKNSDRIKQIRNFARKSVITVAAAIPLLLAPSLGAQTRDVVVPVERDGVSTINVIRNGVNLGNMGLQEGKMAVHDIASSFDTVLIAETQSVSQNGDNFINGNNFVLQLDMANTMTTGIVTPAWAYGVANSPDSISVAPNGIICTASANTAPGIPNAAIIPMVGFYYAAVAPQPLGFAPNSTLATYSTCFFTGGTKDLVEVDEFIKNQYSEIPTNIPLNATAHGASLAPDGTVYVSTEGPSISIVGAGSTPVSINLPGGNSRMRTSYPGTAVFNNYGQAFVATGGAKLNVGRSPMLRVEEVESKEGRQSYISVISTASGKVTNTIPIGDGTAAPAIAITPDGSKLYALVAEEGSLRFAVINAVTFEVVSKQAVGDVGPGMQFPTNKNFAFSGDGKVGYFTLTGGSNLYQVGTTDDSNTVTLIPLTGGTAIGPMGISSQ